MTTNIRHTRQRAAVTAVLRSTWHPLTPVEIRDRASEQVPSLGIATVYRTLRYMCEKGEAEHIAIPGMRSCYSLKRSGPRTFFCCSQTGQVRVIEGGRIELKASQVPEGFKARRYEVIVHGRFQPELQVATTGKSNEKAPSRSSAGLGASV